MFRLNMLWPLALVVFSNILYNTASKSLPRDCSPWLTLVATYITAAALSFIAWLFFESGKNVMVEASRLNWTAFALGLSMVGLEIGFIFMYRAGWPISIAALLANVLLAIFLLAIGVVFYNEKLNAREIIGLFICIGGSIILMGARR